MSTLAEFTDTVVANVIAGITLQDQSSTTTLVENYITSEGGWVPDDVGDPTGEGHLANDEDEDDATTSIIEAEYAKIYESDLTLTVTFNLKRISYLTAGLDEASIKAAIDGTVRNELTDALGALGFITTDSTLDDSDSTTSGVFSAARRVAIAAESPTESYSARVLEDAARSFGLSNLWSISHMFTLNDKPVTYTIKKYTNSSYNVLDSGITYCYVVKADPLTQRIISTLKLDI